MKGVNASRIAALAAGALVLSSSAIAASVMYENVQLVNPNGQPTAKIVVGSSAAASDGVAAANIAAVLANHAYKSSTLTAQVSGQATCATNGTIAGAGTCEISDKKVTITIELPGVLGNAYQFKTLITDTIDKTLGNRINTRSEDNYTTGLTTNDVSTILSPLRATNTVSNNKATNLFRVGGDQYSGFANTPVVDPQAGSDFSYTAEQGFWVGSSADGVLYDSGSAYKQVVAKPAVVAYNLRFLGNDYGVPFCTQVNQTSANGDWQWCSADTSSQYRTDNHRVTIPFMGSQWVISSMSLPSSAAVLNSSTTAYNGGTVKLAKEAKYDIVNVGGVIDGGTFKLRLADISVAVGSGNTHPAILDVLDANDAVIGQVQVNPGETYTYTQSSTGQTIKIHVYRTAPGFTLNAKWAEMAIYTDEITLSDGNHYNLVSSGDPNYNFKVSLLWKNRDYSGTTSSGVPDSLREITIYDEDSFVGTKYVAGDSYDFPKSGSAFRLTYNGLDLTDADYVPVTITALTSTDYPVSNGTSLSDCSDTANKLTYTAKMIQFKTDGNYFGGSSSNLLGNYRLDNFLFDPIGGQLNSSSDGVNQTVNLNGSQAAASAFGNSNVYTPQIFYKPSGYTCYVNATVGLTAANASLNGASIALGTSNSVLFETAGADSGAYGMFYFSNISASNASMSGAIGSIVYQEDAGKNDTVSHTPDVVRIPFLNGTDTWRFKASDSTTSNAYYHGIRDTNGVTNAYEPTVVTERGSKILSVGTTDYSLKVAKKIAQPTFTFAPIGSNGTVTTGSDWIAKEGDMKTLPDGAKLTVKSITQTVGSCTAGTTGAAPACTVNQDALVGKIMPDNVASVDAVQPYTLTDNMVVSDTDAASVGGVVVSVGGPAVNTVTKDILQDAAIDFQTTSVVVKAFGSKIVVAGNTASDTMQAADEFIKALQYS
ncbi:MAG: S-layer protein [Candidatus Micrarchaeota archaeon]